MLLGSGQGIGYMDAGKELDVESKSSLCHYSNHNETRHQLYFEEIKELDEKERNQNFPSEVTGSDRHVRISSLGFSTDYALNSVNQQTLHQLRPVFLRNRCLII